MDMRWPPGAGTSICVFLPECGERRRGERERGAFYVVRAESM